MGLVTLPTEIAGNGMSTANRGGRFSIEIKLASLNSSGRSVEQGRSPTNGNWKHPERPQWISERPLNADQPRLSLPTATTKP